VVKIQEYYDLTSKLTMLETFLDTCV